MKVAWYVPYTSVDSAIPSMLVFWIRTWLVKPVVSGGHDMFGATLQVASRTL